MCTHVVSSIRDPMGQDTVVPPQSGCALIRNFGMRTKLFDSRNFCHALVCDNELTKNPDTFMNGSHIDLCNSDNFQST